MLISLSIGYVRRCVARNEMTIKMIAAKKLPTHKKKKYNWLEIETYIDERLFHLLDLSFLLFLCILRLH